ncbi:ABC transporter permease [Coraliomargarita algicola]|uniref:ABC transporter permease n=1 Tax=Coraliomargarita algicola TaxID=3092156 RepID=A0ABZ0RD17_9BACT|nr:ABC transporter permease [Coraliomargarita sp. J2-16]WPJ94035.1 ABC transporter permease [Coraliomargarita sp. J2-16]
MDKQFIDIGWGALLLYYTMLLIPLAIFYSLGLGLTRSLLWAIVRMTVQLFLVGLYLEFLFRTNSLWLNLLWLLVMLSAANFRILGDGGIGLRRFVLPCMWALSATTLTVAGVMILSLIRPDPWYDARYLIPIVGMILGNCLRGNILSVQHFYAGISKDADVYRQRLSMGATRFEALRPWLALAMSNACRQHLASMATVGIVALPGMMTGQILGGATPMVAIKYQLAIMIAIFVSLTLGAYLNLWLTIPRAFDRMGNLCEDVQGSTWKSAKSSRRKKH